MNNTSSQHQSSVQNNVIAGTSREITAASSRGSSRTGSKRSLTRGSDGAGSAVSTHVQEQDNVWASFCRSINNTSSQHNASIQNIVRAGIRNNLRSASTRDSACARSERLLLRSNRAGSAVGAHLQSNLFPSVSHNMDNTSSETQGSLQNNVIAASSRGGRSRARSRRLSLQESDHARLAVGAHLQNDLHPSVSCNINNTSSSVQNNVIAGSSCEFTAASSHGESSRAGSNKRLLLRGSDRAVSAVGGSSTKRAKRDDDRIYGGLLQESHLCPMRSRSSIASCTVSRPRGDDDSDDDASLHRDARVRNAGLS